ncbi:hypothetical protein GCM10007897_25280 [Sphingobium jiangsuense]|uniref:Uncharacterized protein n=1 Tax=Sphingobium jiangsuense TaxID=870476 RepID=A0A7W6BM44_9SPHN|nr:hypothetical protein [Sphingobium jiangsuense]MBB3928354.1 hypothetical protein [Sphingobium jiangsuense]GLT01137.1 hypothetical protein GCM10007897_25280 [Sphingobium jiangsuense]
MKSNTAVHLMSAPGEIFSHDATSQDHEKIVATPAIAPVPACDTAGDVTLMSKPDHTCPPVEKMQDAEFVHNLQHLTKMQLRAQYVAEANSHRNMLTRSKQKGDKVHPDFREFRNFLRLVGPMPVSGATLDRIDNTDREYAPGKVRWADKRTQNNNKGDTLTIYDQRTGEVFTASRIAKLQGVSASAIRHRLTRGWSDAQIIAGTRSSPLPTSDKQLPPVPPTQSVEPRAKTQQIVPTRSRSAREIQFERMAEYIALCRERDGEEALPAPHYVINEGEPEAWHVTEEQWLARFERLWPEYRPHIIFERADPYHQRAIELIDPEYVRRERAKIARREELKALL